MKVMKTKGNTSGGNKSFLSKPITLALALAISQVKHLAHCPPLSLPRRWQMRAFPQPRNIEKLRCCIQGIKKLNEIACQGKDINKDLHKELDKENPQSK